MSASNAGTSSTFPVRLAKDRGKKKHVVFKFRDPITLAADKCKCTLQRENNLQQFKVANNITSQPKFGAGSEYGKEEREEQRRRKMGFNPQRKYNVDKEPFMLTINDKQTKKSKTYKGSLEAPSNTSWYVFIPSKGPDGNYMEAVKLDSWYNFTPTISYNYLKSEEAEEAFTKRHQMANIANLVVRKKLQQQDVTEEDLKQIEEETRDKGKRKLILTETDDWVDSDDEPAPDSDAEEPSSDKEEAAKGKKKKMGRIDVEGEPVEESDEGDRDDEEQADYVTSSEHDSSDEEEVGVADESAMKEDDAEEEVKEEVKDEKDEDSADSGEEGDDSDVDPDLEDVKAEPSQTHTPIGSKRKLAEIVTRSGKRIAIDAPSSSLLPGKGTNRVPTIKTESKPLDEILTEVARSVLSSQAVTLNQLVAAMTKRRPELLTECSFRERLSGILKALPLQKNVVNGEVFLRLKS